MRAFVRRCTFLKFNAGCLRQQGEATVRGSVHVAADHNNQCYTESVSSTQINTNSNADVNVLPPWPVDEIEFNTQLPNGGHDARRAHEKQLALSLPSAAKEGNCARVSDCTDLLRPQIPTEEQQEEISRVEKTTEGVRALGVGGWVCGSCFSCMPHRSRSVCDFCYTIRHDAERAVAGWRKDPQTWFCSHCCEFNFERDTACRCCTVRRDEQMEINLVHHARVLDEIQRAAVGSVIVTRNRVSRWRCILCNESNALQSSHCRHCNKERFDFTVCCPICKAQQKLCNKKMYGSEPADHIHVARPFGLHNCFPRLSPELRCISCKNSLHGAIASSRSDAWLCGCGIVNNHSTMSCTRCRFPRRVSQTSLLEELLRVWDFAGTTNWYCESCNHVNRASRHVVALERNSVPSPTAAMTTTASTSSFSSQATRSGGGICRGARIVHGLSRCEGCGLPWHNQSLNDGKHWRCACLKVNHCDDTRCQVCHLPAVDGIRSDVLSFWSRGDWYCTTCLRQNYREKLTCTCGESRPME